MRTDIDRKKGHANMLHVERNSITRLVGCTYLGLQSTLIAFPQLRPPCFSLLFQVRELLNFRLVKAVDDRILSLFHMYALHLRCYQ